MTGHNYRPCEDIGKYDTGRPSARRHAPQRKEASGQAMTSPDRKQPLHFQNILFRPELFRDAAHQPECAPPETDAASPEWPDSDRMHRT